MATPRLIAPTTVSVTVGDLLPLSDSEWHHVTRVLRLSMGDTVEVVGEGGVWRGTLEQSSVRVLEKLPPPSSMHVRKQFLCALLKGEKTDLVTDWLTELGAESIVWWQSTNSVVKLRSAEDREKRENRLRKIAESAVKQSRRSSLPTLRVVPSLEEALELIPHARSRFVASLEPGSPPFLTVLGNLHFSPDGVCVAIGPEGDFTPEEYRALKAGGFAPFSLGGTVLRSELAALSAASGLLLLTKPLTEAQ